MTEIVSITVHGHTLYPVHWDDTTKTAHDGGELAKRFSRERLASIRLPGVYVDDRGWLVCSQSPMIAAILLVEAAIVLAKQSVASVRP